MAENQKVALTIIKIFPGERPQRSQWNLHPETALSEMVKYVLIHKLEVVKYGRRSVRIATPYNPHFRNYLTYRGSADAMRQLVAFAKDPTPKSILERQP